MAIITAAVFAGDYLQSRIEFIPRWLIRLPEVSYSRQEFWTIAEYFLLIYAVLFLLGQFLAGIWHTANSKRTVDELFIVAAGFATTALIVFVTTSVSFDPQLFIGVAVTAAVLVLIVHVIAVVATGSRYGGPLAFIKALFARIFSIPGILILVLAVSPGILAKLFVSDRDVANTITRIRMAFALNEDYQWTLVNALPGKTFAQPILVQFPPNRNDELFILERGGIIKRIAWPMEGSAETVLDIADRVGFIEFENGALGFDFHPDFGKKGDDNEYAIYLYYTSVQDGEQVNYLSRFDLRGTTPESRKGSEQRLISWDRPEDGFHNGGSVEFGPDGFLYVALGEMATRDSHQKISESMVSGVLRIDVDERGGTVSQPINRRPVNGTSGGYFIPSDNPFVGKADALEEFWALGLRNPFRISFDPQTGELWAGDVGSTIWEEVNVVRKGHNYQFPYIEGRKATGIAKPETIIGIETGPVYTYRHTAYDRAVIGGVVYRGDRFAELQGLYVFGDNYSGKIYALPSDKDSVESVADLTKAPMVAQRGITSFTQSPDGEILITALGKASEATGVVYRLAKQSEEGLADRQSETLESKSRPVSADEAAELYRVSCSRCHGNAGKGDGPDGPHMGVPMPDLTDPASLKSRDNAALRKVILEGGAATGLSPMMPPWGQILDEQELDGVVRYIEQLGESPRGD
jgi:glucose/arabinose dehydrogenase